jgi:hypothetical protein
MVYQTNQLFQYQAIQYRIQNATVSEYAPIPMFFAVLSVDCTFLTPPLLTLEQLSSYPEHLVGIYPSS